MIQITISSKDAKRVAKGLKAIGPGSYKETLNRINVASVKIVGIMKTYPPKRPGQRYVRTYKFRNSWGITDTGTGSKIKNTVSYGKYVVGGAYGTGQAWMHVGRWKVFRDVVDNEFSKLPKQVQGDIGMVARRDGGFT